MEFEKMMESEASKDLNQKALEVPQEIQEAGDINEDACKDTESENKDLTDALKPENIQDYVTVVNTSRHGCGCNNACFHACTNIR